MRKQTSFPRRQSGAALYIALIMLILMALIGLVAMQVAGLQERMSANYQASSMAFQNAEAEAREQENTLKTAVNTGAEVPTSLPPRDCGKTAFDAESYAGAEPYVRRLDLCFSWGGLDYPTDESERTDQIYQITAFAKDRASVFASSESVIDTVFIP